MRCLFTAAALVLVAGCGGSSTPVSAPAPDAPTSSPPTAAGGVSRSQLVAWLLQPADLPELPQRRLFSSTELSTQATPQLALCRPPRPVAPHQLANAIAESATIGQVKVFEVLSVYGDAEAARAAYLQDVANTRGCLSYRVQSTDFRIQDLLPVAVPGGAEALHYTLMTPAVVGGDARTFARKGRFTVLITGYGTPPAGQLLLEFQAAVLRKALARLP